MKSSLRSDEMKSASFVPRSGISSRSDFIHRRWISSASADFVEKSTCDCKCFFLVGAGGFVTTHHAACGVAGERGLSRCMMKRLLPSRSGSLTILSHQTKRQDDVLPFCLVGAGGFGPPKSVTTDLQSAPFGRSGTLPYGAGERSRTINLLITNQLLCH